MTHNASYNVFNGGRRRGKEATKKKGEDFRKKSLAAQVGKASIGSGGNDKKPLQKIIWSSP